MILNPNEEGKFWNFRGFVEEHVLSKFHFIFPDNSEIECTYFTSCESDNGLELDDTNYEEYWILIFKNILTKELFEINYHNMPIEIWCDGTKIDLDK